MCNTTSGLDHRWEFTVVPENASYTTRRPISLTGVSGIPTTPLSIGNSMITFSRLSGPNILPLISRITISPVSRGLNGTVVSCFELATNSVATTTIQIIDTQQFGRTSIPHGKDIKGLCILCNDNIDDPMESMINDHRQRNHRALGSIIVSDHTYKNIDNRL